PAELPVPARCARERERIRTIVPRRDLPQQRLDPLTVVVCHAPLLPKACGALLEVSRPRPPPLRSSGCACPGLRLAATYLHIREQFNGLDQRLVALVGEATRLQRLVEL